MNIVELSNMNIDTNFLAIINGCINTSLLVIFLCVYNFVSANLKNWYKMFQLTAFIFDVTTLLLIIILTKYVHSALFGNFHLYTFLAVAICIQIVYSCLYCVLVNNYWIKNDMFLFHKNYIQDVGLFYYLCLNIFIITSAILLSAYYCFLTFNSNVINMISSFYFYAFMINEV